MKQILKSTLLGGNFAPVATSRSRLMSRIRSSGNRTTELKLRFALVRRGIRGWQVQPTNLLGRPDFYFPDLRIVLFVDGCFWHGCPNCGHLPRTNVSFWATKILDNKRRDCFVTKELLNAGFRVLRFWEHDLNRISRVIDKLQREIDKKLHLNKLKAV
jgi:DNA mismatch endonuclease, patch repair protein